MSAEFFLNEEIFKKLQNHESVYKHRRTGGTYTLLCHIWKENAGNPFIGIPNDRHSHHIRHMWRELFPEGKDIRFYTRSEQLRGQQGTLYFDECTDARYWCATFGGRIIFGGGVWSL